MDASPDRAANVTCDDGSTLLHLRIACLMLAFVSCLPGLVQLEFLWRESEYLGHGYLIPPTAAVLAYARRADVKAALRAGEAGKFGVLAVLAASLLEAIAVLAHKVTSAGIGVPFVLGATAYAVGGRPLLRAGGPSLSFLLLMVPPPRLVQDRLLIDLKSFVVWTSVGLLQELGFTIAATGNRIFVPQGELFVADACSGLTSLVTLIPLAAVVAYFLCRGIWRRAVVVAAVVPIALFGNVTRVVVTVALVSRFGIDAAGNLLHESFGIMTFSIGTLLLISVAKLVR